MIRPVPLARAAALAAVLVLWGCPPSGPPPSSPPSPRAVPASIHWTRTAAEHRVLFEQTYVWAAQRVEERAEGRTPGTWAVILDADETVLDNSEYQLRRARQGLGFTPESWTEWVREEAAPALPGAVAFVHRVQDLGGRVAIVTNRTAAECAPTRRNLTAVGLRVDAVLCRRPGEQGKDGRFRQIQEGGADTGLPPLEVLAWVGDNIRDFPGGSQALRNADPARLADFGRRFFLLPNPMYGSWQGNPER